MAPLRHAGTTKYPGMPMAAKIEIMIRAVAWCLVAALMAGCESGEEPVRGANRGLQPLVYQPQPRPEREPVDAPRPERDVDLPELVERTAKEERKRDLSAELRAAVGVPIDCIRDFTYPRPTKVRVSVTATVRPTGMVITPAAYGTGLSAAARDCIERRVENVVLKPLDEQVSERVSTIVEIDYTPEVIVESEPGVPEPRLRNVKEPLPKRPEVAPSGTPIQKPTSKWISGGFDGGLPIEGPKPKKIEGPKPRPIDGYEVDQNAQEWR
jgi:hypothetical protein